MLTWFKEAASPAAPLILDIKIDDKRTFTTLECFTGTLEVKASVDTAFDRLDIKLIGTSRTYGRRVVPQAPNARTVTTAHRFLELNQPNMHLHFPEYKIFKAGCTYQFAFQFAIPERMLPATCRHTVFSPCVHDLHTLMPPSFGDSAFGGIVDYAPRHVSIKYRVVARLHQLTDSGDHRVVGNCSERVRFVPLNSTRTSDVEDWDPDRRTHEEMSLRKFWNKPTGKLVISSVQASPFQIKDIHSGIWCGELRGRVYMNLEFQPTHEGAKPPTRIDLDAIFRAETVSAVIPLPQLPSSSPWAGPEIDKHTSPSIILSCQPLGGIEWILESQGITPPPAECPIYEKSPSSPQAYPDTYSKPYYSARIEASLSTMLGFSMAPTFHSCLFSRMYQVEMRLGVRGSVFEFAPAIRFKVPVQVVREKSVIRRDSMVEPRDSTEDIVERRSDVDLIDGSMWESLENLGTTGHVDAPPRYEFCS